MSSQPVKMTEEQLKTSTAQHLLTLLEEVSADGVLTDKEIFMMNEWLSRHEDKQIPALSFLRTLIEDVVADHVITEPERHAIVSAILRVMPEGIDHEARLHFGSMSENPDWILGHHPALNCQKRMMEELGIEIPYDCSRADALHLIKQAVNRGQALPSLHLMVLRFWGREDLTGYMKAACEWLDNWYAEDADRYAAWRMWRKEHPECSFPEGVAAGLGNLYLQRIKA